MIVTGTNSIPQLTIGTNSVQHLTMHVIRQFLPYFDNDGYWEQFGTRSDSAIELLPCFDNDGHWSKLGTGSDPAMELLPYFDNDGHWNQFRTTPDHTTRIADVILIMMVTGTNLVPLDH